MEKNTFEEWVKDKYESRGIYWISLKEKNEWGFAESDLSHYPDKGVRGKYNRYLNAKPKEQKL